MKHIFLLLLSILSITSFSQFQSEIECNFRLKYFIENDTKSQQSIGLFVKGARQDAISFTKEVNGSYRGSIKGWQFIRVPSNKVEGLLSDKRFSNIDYAPYKGETMGDTMRVNNKIDSIHSGATPLASSFTGQNVIAGFIDTGIDFAHPDFRTADDKTRILQLWDQTKGTNANTPSTYGYGQHWDSTQINAGSSTNQDQWGHGSTVAGTAVSNGLANGTHKGAAPDTYIIAVESKFNAADWLATFVDAVEYIYEYSDSYNMPCVINASVGTYLGSHDGLDPYALYIDSLINSSRGHLFTASAGNSGDWDKYHLHVDVTADTSFSWFTANTSSAFGGTAAYWELWADTAEFNNVTYTIGADMVNPNYYFSGRTQDMSVAGNLNTMVYDTIRNDNNDIIATTQIWAEQRDGQYLIQVYMPEPDSVEYLFRFETFGSGSYDAWSVEDYGMSKIIDTIPSVIVYPELDDYVLPDSLQSIVSSFQCLPSVITVGNYVNDSGYVTKYGGWYSSGYERGSLFKSSSKGPTRLGFIKPEVCATGQGTSGPAPIFRINQWVAGNNDSLLAYGGMHMSNGGTSMASPVVAGVGALLLEKCPTMTQVDYRNAILNNTYQDGYSGSTLPNNAWGYGKLDGFAAVSSTNYMPLYSGDTLFCFGDSAAINMSSNYETVLWENGSINFLEYFPNTDTTLITVIDSAGCASDTLWLRILEAPEVTINQITAPYYHCENDSVAVNLTGSNLVSAVWEDGSTDLNHHLEGSQTTYAIGEDANGCTSDTAWIQIVENALPNTPVLSQFLDNLNTDGGYINYDWNLDGSFYSNTGTDSSLVIIQNGDYAVTITDINGCQSTSTPFDFNSTNISYLENNLLTVYPNPTNGLFQVEASMQLLKVAIFNQLGQLVYTEQQITDKIQIDISSLPKGVYNLQIFTNNKQFVHKIVLNK